MTMVRQHIENDIYLLLDESGKLSSVIGNLNDDQLQSDNILYHSCVGFARARSLQLPHIYLTSALATPHRARAW